MNEETILKVLNEYDMIISDLLFFYPISVEYQPREMFEHSKVIDEAISITCRKLYRYSRNMKSILMKS